MSLKIIKEKLKMIGEHNEIYIFSGNFSLTENNCPSFVRIFYFNFRIIFKSV